jgi:membrane protease YdiL (CAAX protease family)
LWPIVGNMNEKVISAETNPRFSRIKKLSRFLKILFWIYFVVLGLVLTAGHVKIPAQAGEQAFSSLRDIPSGLKIYEAFRYSLYLLAVIVFYRLLNLYEKGIILSAENVSHIRRLGELAVFYGAFTACRSVFVNHQIEFPTLPVNFLLSPWLIVGCLIVIVAWVMDEGRKIQEEQALTV